MLLATVAFMYLGLTSHFLFSGTNYKIKTSLASGLNDDKRSRGHAEHARGQDQQEIRHQDDLRQTPTNATDVVTSKAKSDLKGSLRELSWHPKNEGRLPETWDDLLSPSTTSITDTSYQSNISAFARPSANEDKIIINGIRLRLSINQADICDRDPEKPEAPRLLVQVHSDCHNKPQRDAIRATWGRLLPTSGEVKPRVVVTFLLGACDMTQSSNAKIEHESSLYRDIVQWDFLDSYANLTVKSLAGLIWAQRYCADAQFLLKADDDLYVNISGVLSLTTTQLPPLIGHVYPKSKPARSGLWRVSELQYPAEVYPPYCSGTAYLMWNSTAVSLMHAFWMKRPTTIPIEDIYITGILAGLSGIQCKHSPLFPSWAAMPSLRTLHDLLRGKLLGMHGVTYERMYHINHVINKCIQCGTDASQVRKWFDWIKRQKTYG